VRAMDCVVDIARYPLDEQENEATSKRRMGLGVTGAANTIEAILGGPSYGSTAFCSHLSQILRTLRDSAYEASADIAKEKGPFPLYDKEKYLEGEFIQSLSLQVQDEIADNGIRNSHLLSIAPTGTISYCADNISSGIEPVFAHEINRTIIEAEGTREVALQDYGVRYLGVKGKKADECTTQDHLAVLITASRYVDSAVSKTCNVPTSIPWNDFKEIYIQAYDNGCKGCTTYRAGGKRAGILKDAEADSLTSVDGERDEEKLSCEIDPLTGRRNCE
jgi:ribonucleoside-diphosphate reductase alpha chain